MTREEKEEALDVLTDMANALQLIPTTRQGKVFKMVLQELQKPEQKWIPVSEEYPKETGIYWVITKNGELTLSYFIPALNTFIIADVIAWTPFIVPKPYKANSTGEEVENDT